MKKTVIFYLFLLGLIPIAHCGQMSRMELTDGSIINAEVMSLENGTYALNSETLGQIKIEAGKVRKIEALNTNPLLGVSLPGLSNADIQSKVDNVRKKIQDNPEITKTIEGLANDPQFQGVLKDPAIADAVKKGDYQALFSNPKFIDLTNNQKVQEIKDKVKE